MDTLRSLPGPSQLLPPPQEAPAPQASPVSSPALFSSPELPWLVQMGRGPGAACGLKASCPLPFPPGLIAAGSTVPLPGLGLGCGDSHLCQRGSTARAAGSPTGVTGCQIGAHPPRDSPQRPLPLCHLCHVCVASVTRCRGGVPGEKVGMGTTEPPRGWHLCAT